MVVVVDPVEVDRVVVAEYDIAIEAKTQTDKVQSDWTDITTDQADTNIHNQLKNRSSKR